MVRYGYNAIELTGKDIHDSLALIMFGEVVNMLTSQFKILAEKQLSKISLL